MAMNGERTEGKLCELLHVDYPYLHCQRYFPRLKKWCGWTFLITRPIDRWPSRCPKCGSKDRASLMWKEKWISLAKLDEPLRAKVSNKAVEIRRTKLECRRDPLVAAIESELQVAAEAFGIKGRRWRETLKRENDLMEDPYYSENPLWEHIPRALRVRLECIKTLDWLVRQWWDGALMEQPNAAESFDEDLAEMRRLLEFVKANPYDMRAKAAA